MVLRAAPGYECYGVVLGYPNLAPDPVGEQVARVDGTTERSLREAEFRAQLFEGKELRELTVVLAHLGPFHEELWWVFDGLCRDGSVAVAGVSDVDATEREFSQASRSPRR